MSNIGKIKRIIKVVPIIIQQPAAIPATIPEPAEKPILVPDWPVRRPVPNQPERIRQP